MKKTLIIFLLLTLMLTQFSTLAATPYFTDTDGHWAEEYTETLRRLGIMNGTDQAANTEASVTRGEFAALTARAVLDVDYGSYTTYFEDVSKNHIFAPYISAAYESDIIKGIDGLNFAPDRPITREQIAIMLTRLGLLDEPSGKINFKDIPGNYKYYSEINTCVQNNVITGYDDKTFRPQKNATRAETAAMLVRTLYAAEITPNKSEIKEFADDYFASDRDKTGFVMEASMGQALDDLKYKNEITAGISPVKKSYENFKADVTSVNGMLSEVEYNGSVTFDTDTYSKKYNVKTIYRIININGSFKVYDTNTDYSLPHKINLTWEVGSSAPTYSPVGLTHISPTAFQLSETAEAGQATDVFLGSIKLYNNLRDSHLSYAADNGYDVWAMYKTDFTVKTANAVLNNQDARRSIIRYLMKQCLTRGVTGINFDFENMYKSDKEAFYNHVREMELAMHEIGVIVSADITRYEKTSAQWSLCYDRDRIAEYADYIMLMAYDQYYAGSKTPGPVGGLSWVEDSIKLTLTEVPAEKLVLGIPFYTRYWETQNGYVTSTKAISMESAIRLIKENNPQLIYIEEDGQHKAVWSKNNIECSFWFETAETIGKRVDIANKYKLAGVASWRRGFETADVWTEIDNNLN